MLFLKYIHSAGRCTRMREEEYPTSDVMNSIESNVAYLQHFLQVLLGSFVKSTNTKLQDTSLWRSKKNLKLNVWSLKLSQKIKNLFSGKRQDRALGGIFSGYYQRYTKKSSPSWQESDLKNKSLKYEKSEKQTFEISIREKKWQNYSFSKSIC